VSEGVQQRRYEINHGKIHKLGAAERHFLRLRVKKASDTPLIYQGSAARQKT
jgi:hypothetical protein